MPPMFCQYPPTNGYCEMARVQGYADRIHGQAAAYPKTTQHSANGIGNQAWWYHVGRSQAESEIRARQRARREAKALELKLN